MGIVLKIAIKFLIDIFIFKYALFASVTRMYEPTVCIPGSFSKGSYYCIHRTGLSNSSKTVPSLNLCYSLTSISILVMIRFSFANFKQRNNVGKLLLLNVNNISRRNLSFHLNWNNQFPWYSWFFNVFLTKENFIEIKCMKFSRYHL